MARWDATGSAIMEDSVSSSVSADGCMLARRKRAVDPVGDEAAVEAPGREVDGHAQARDDLPPRLELPERPFEHPPGEGVDEPGALGHGDELHRGDRPELFVRPAQQRLAAQHLAGAELNDGLVPDLQRLVLDGAAQLRGQGQAAQRGTVLGRVVEAHSPARLLRQVHGDVGVAHQVGPVAGPSVGGGDGDAHAGADVEQEAFHGKWLLDDAHEPVARRLDRDPACRRQQHRELVAAEARHHAVLARERPQPAGHLEQDGVAGHVPESVVDFPEAVEVDQHDRHAGLRRSISTPRPDAR